MFRLARRNARVHAPRFVLTALAVSLSVGFLVATLVLSASMTGTAADDIAAANADLDAVVTGQVLVEGEGGPGEAVADTTQALPAATVSIVEGVDGVAGTAEVIRGFAKLFKNGEAIGDDSALDVGRNWIANAQLNPFKITTGAAPTWPGEVAIDGTVASHASLVVGDSIQLLTDTGLHDVTITGIVSFGGADAEPSRRTTLVAEPFAAEILGESGASQVLIEFAANADPADVIQALSDALSGATVRTGAEYVAAEQSAITSPIAFLSAFLLAFAGVATVVSTTIIYNTVSIALAQRRRESALLRAIGAERRQVLLSVMIETAIIGVGATAIGLGLGLLGVGALKSLMTTVGLTFLDGPTVISTTSLAIAASAGLFATLISAWFPARRAASAAPVEALRAAATEDLAFSRARSIAGVTTLAGGTVALVSAVIFSNSLLMIGAVLLLPGLIATGPAAVHTTSGIARRLLRRFSGVEGAMASTNLERSPRRASSTSLAFALGIGLIGFFTVLASTLSAQVADDLDSALQADYVVTSVSTEFGTIDPGLVSRLEDLDGVDIASAASQTEGVVDGEPTNIGGIDPEVIGAVVDLGVLEGSLAALASGGVAVVREDAKTDPSLGQELRIRTEGGTITAPVVAVVSTSLGGFDAPSYFVARDTLAALETGLLDTNIYVRASTEAAANEIRDIVAEMPGSLFETRASYLASTGTEVNDFLNFIYAMLGLTVIIALVGVANTTALAMNERIQEIGLLRAIGTTRASIQRMVLLEAALLATLGTVIGLSIALAGAWTLVMVVSGGPFVVPWLSLGVIAAGGVVAGILAASYAGWRASRRPALEAIAIV